MELIWVLHGFLFVLQKKMDQMVDLIKRLKICVRWCFNENEKLHSEVEFAVKKCCDTGISLLLSFVVDEIMLSSFKIPIL